MFRLRQQDPESTLPGLSAFKDFAEGLDSAVVLVTPERRIAYMNHAAKQMWGNREGSLCYRALRDSRKVCSGCPLGRVVETCTVGRQETRMNTADGWHTFDKLFIPVKDSESSPRLVALVCNNIDYQKSLEKQVVGERGLSEAILSSQSTFLIGLGEDGRVEFVNSAWETVSGYSEREMIDVGGFRAIVPAERRGEVDDYLSSVSKGIEHAGRLVVPVMTKSGEERIFSWTCSPVSTGGAGLGKAVMIGQDVTERVKARMEVERWSRELVAVNEILRKAGTAVSIEEMLEAALSVLVGLPGYRCGAAYLIGEKGESAKRLATMGFSKGEPARSMRGIERVFPATAIYDRKVEFAWRDTDMLPQVREPFIREGLQGIVAIPIVPGGHPAGIMLLGHDLGPEGVEEDRSIMEAVAEAFELGAQNLCSRASAEEHASEASALYRIARGMAEDIALDRTLERVAQEAAALLGIDVCTVFLYEEDTGVLSAKAAVGADVGSIELPLSERGAALEASRTLEPVFIDDAERDFRVPKSLVERYGIKSSLVMPLIVEDEFAGVIFFGMKRKREYIEKELDLIKSFTEQASLAVRNATLLDDLRKSEEKYRLVVESEDDIVFTIDADSRITFVNERIRTVLGSEPEELLGYSYLEHVDEADKGYLGEVTSTVVSGGSVSEARLPIRHKDGTEVLLNLQINPMVVDGRVTGAVGVARDVTEQVRAQEALRDSEERYRTLVDNYLLGVLLHDGKKVIYMNDKALEICGYSRGDINGLEDFLNILVPEERERVDALMARQIAGGESPSAYETRIRRKDGSIEVVQVQSSLIGLGGRNVIMFALTDVTDRVRAEAAVIASEERYRAVVETSPNTVLITDSYGEILFANRTAGEVAGVPAEELTGRKIDEFLAPEELGPVEEAYESARLTGRGVARRLTRALTGGIERYYEASASVIGGSGLDAKVYIVANDVTERELAQRALRESEERYRAIVESSRDIIMTINRGGEILYINPEVEASFGFRPEYAVGTHIFRYLHPDDRERVAESIARDFKTGKPTLNFEARCLNFDGSIIHLEVNSSLLGWPGEDAVEMMVMRDVTERKAQEQERELRLKVEEALADIATRFVSPDDIYGAIGRTVEQTGELLSVGRAHYFEFSADGETMSCIVEWVADGVEPTKDRLQDLRIADYPWWVENFFAGGTLVKSDIEDIPEEAIREVLRAQNVVALAVAPILMGERLVGFMSYHDVLEKREWSLPEEEMVRVVADTISHELERREWLTELEHSERFRSRITESMDEGLMVLRDGAVTWANRRASEMLGYGPEEFLEQTTDDLFPRPAQETLALGATKALLSGERYISEEKARRKDGSMIEVMITASSFGAPEEESAEILAAMTDVTEARRMREQVEAAAEAYSTIFSVAGDGLVVASIDGVIKDVNERMCSYTGFSREELLSKNLVDLVPERVRHLYPERREEMLRYGYTEFETRLLKKDGGTMPVAVSSRMATVWGEEAFLSALHDITERKRAEAETARRAEQLSSLNEILKAATRSLDIDMASKEVLAASVEFAGADCGLLVLESTPGAGQFEVLASEGFNPEQLEKLDNDVLKEELVGLASEPGVASVLDAPLPAAGEECKAIADVFGKEKFASSLLIPLKRDDKTTGVLCLASGREGLFREENRDFYNAAGAEIRVALQNAIIYRQLVAEHERLALLYRSAQDISEQADLDALLSTIAREATEAVGAESAFVALVEPGRDVFFWSAAYNLDLGMLEGIHMQLDKGLGGEVLRQKRAVFFDPATAPRDQLRGDPLAALFRDMKGIGIPLAAGDDIIGVMSVQCRIDQRISDEDVLLLEALGRHAGIGIENRRLYEETRLHLQALEVAHQELLELDRMKSDFVSTVSHELRSPLAVIEGFARTLVEHFERIDSDTERESLEIILKKSTILEGLIANILDMSRIEAGRLEVHFEELDLLQLCRRVIGDQERMAEVHKLRLVEPEGEMRVSADFDKVEVVLGNIIGNAIKFSPQGGNVTVTVKKAGDYAEVSVTDEGIGISPGEFERIFDRFYQVESGSARSFPGTGLGLYITSELLRSMGGDIKVESEPGKGSTFTFTLPLAHAGGAAEGPA